MNKKEAVINIIRDWNTEDIVNAWNEYCNDEGDMDNYIHPNDDDIYNEIFSSIGDAIRSIAFGDFRYNDDYICFNGYANIDSFNFYDDDNSPIDIDRLADYLIENGDANIKNEIGTDYLEEYFIDFIQESNPEVDRDKAEDIMSKLNEEEPFDLLTEDWNDLKETFINNYNK